MAWIWGCDWENGASNWADHDRCISGSRRPLKTEAQARNALARHRNKARHSWTEGWVRKIHGNTKLT